MLNNVSLIGNLTSDPELRSLQSGASVCTMQIAVNDRYKSGDEWKEDPCFIEIQAWSGTGEACASKLVKGDQIAVTGKLKLATWTGKDGGKRSKHFVRADSVDFLKWNRNATGQEGTPPPRQSQPQPQPEPQGDYPSYDDIPF